MRLFAFIAIVLMPVLTGFADAQNISALRPGDSINITVNSPAEAALEITATYCVNAEGAIKLPRLATPVQAEGLSYKEFARSVENAYKAAGVFAEPGIQVALCTCGGGAISTPRVTVGGEVKSGGREVPFRDGMRLYQAIVSAGEFSEFADFRHVKVIRGRTATSYDLRKIAPDGSNNPVLQDGDTIHVPYGTAEPPKTPAEPAAPADVAVEKKPALLKAGDRVIVELKCPAADSPNVTARYTIAADGTLRLPYLKESLAVAGLELKDLEQKIAKAYREAGIYKAPEFKASLPPVDAKLVPGVSVGGEVKQTGRVIPIGDKSLRLYQAIMAAGGLTEFADVKRIKMFRDGTETSYDLRRTVDDGRNNPVLQDGDTVFVPRD